MHAFKTSFLSTTAGIVMLLSLAAFALHVQGTAQASQHQASDAPQAVSDSELESFVQAYKKIAEIRSDHESRLREVQDPQKAQELQQEAQGEMMNALQEEALTVERYNAIFAAVQNRETVRQKFEDMWERMAEQP